MHQNSKSRSSKAKKTKSKKGYKSGGIIDALIDPISAVSSAVGAETGMSGAIIAPGRRLSREYFNANSPVKALFGQKYIKDKKDISDDTRKKYSRGGAVTKGVRKGGMQRGR